MDEPAADPAAPAPGPTTPAVVAVVVTHEPGPWFEDGLRALAAQDYPDLTVLVIDAGSPEMTKLLIAAGAELNPKDPEMGQSPIIVIVAGMITGIAGGIIRDVLCNDIPLVFSGELYATVSIVTGAIYYLGVSTGFPTEAVTILAAVIGFALRVLAIVFNWSMPKFIYDKELR